MKIALTADQVRTVIALEPRIQPSLNGNMQPSLCFDEQPCHFAIRQLDGTWLLDTDYLKTTSLWRIAIEHAVHELGGYE